MFVWIALSGVSIRIAPRNALAGLNVFGLGLSVHVGITIFELCSAKHILGWGFGSNAKPWSPEELGLGSQRAWHGVIAKYLLGNDFQERPSVRGLQ